MTGTTLNVVRAEVVETVIPPLLVGPSCTALKSKPGEILGYVVSSC